MIRHIVLIKFQLELSDSAVDDLFTELHELKNEIDGILTVSSGANNSPEQMDKGFLHGFTIDFENLNSLNFYLEHKSHKRFGSKLVASSIGGADGILCFDIEV